MYIERRSRQSLSSPPGESPAGYDVPPMRRDSGCLPCRSTRSFGFTLNSSRRSVAARWFRTERISRCSGDSPNGGRMSPRCPSRPRTSSARRGISRLPASVGSSTRTTRPGRSLSPRYRPPPIPMAWSTQLPCGTSRRCRRDRSSIGPGRQTIGASDIHFYGERSSDRHPLAQRHLSERQREFRDLVRRAALEHPDAAWLRGGSWLYSVEAYRRIFPDVFIAGLEPSEHDLQFLACWGQLLDGAWRTRTDVASRLLQAVELASTTDELEAAFPYPMQRSRVPFSSVVA